MKSPIFVGFSATSMLCVALLNGQTPAPKPAAPAATAPAPGVLSQSAAPAQAPDAVIISIGDQKITRAEYELFINGLPDQIKAQAAGPNKRRVAEQYAELKMMAQEARKRKVDQDPKTKTQIEFQLDQILASTLFKNLQSDAKVDDAAILAYYNAHKNEYEEVKARHILIRFKDSRVPLKDGQKDLTKEESLAKAKEIKAKLDGGADFAALAKAESDDTVSGAAGGDLGFFAHGSMVPQFEEAAFAQAPGKVSEPVESPFGYHLILVDEKRAKPLADMKADIEAKLRPEQARQQVEGIKKATPITIDDTYFGK